jgi:hypothetical protein
VIDPIYGIDGLRNYSGGTEVLTGTTITSKRRRAGMIVGINDGTTFYKLKPGWSENLTMSNWELFSLGSSFTGGTVSGATIFTSGLTANTISATTYQNLPSTPFLPLSGGTVSGATIFTDGLSANTISASTYYNLPKIQNLITVAKSGGDFTSIKAAVDNITASGSDNRYVIKVGPGIYYEDEITLQGKEFISVVGTDILQVVVVANSVDQTIFRLGNNNELSFMTISGATDGVGIGCDNIGGFSLIHKISIYDCDTNIYINAEGVDSNFYGEYVDFNGDYSYGVRIIADFGHIGYANMENYYNYPTGTKSTIANSIEGSGATLSVFVGDGIGNGVVGSTNYQLSDYSSLNTIATTADNWDYGIRVLNNGGPSTFDVDSYSIVGSLTWDLFVQHPGTFGTFGGGSSSHSKIRNLSDSVYWAFLDTIDGEFDITRKISVTFQDGTHTDMSTLIFAGGTMGLISGGIITSGTGLNINVSNGFGYLEQLGGSEIYQRIDWSNTGTTLSPNSNSYLYFNETGLLNTLGARPNTINNIVIGRVVTNSTGVEFIDESPVNANHTSNRYGSLFREAIGPIYAFGSIVTENITPFNVDVTGGEYYYSTNEYLPSGGSGLTFTQYYNDGVGGWNTSATTVVNHTQFDNNGVLSGLTASAFTKHTFYIVGSGLNEKYFLVLGQNEYGTLIECENALLPIPPTFFNDSVSQIANIYIKQGNSNILQIEDIRPVIGFKAGGVNASSLHANLLGLTSDDHKQYLLVDGSRAMGDVLNMGNNSIISAGTINGVTIQSHASRHQNGGDDEVGTFTPTASAIPKANTSGKLDSWISDSSSSVKGLTKLSVDPLSATTPIAVGLNDPRFQKSITGVTNTSGSLTFSNNSGETTSFTGLSVSTISATTYTNVTHSGTTGLQGGSVSLNEYYHLTLSELNRVKSLIYVNNVVSFSISATTGERGVSQPLNVIYRMTPNDDIYTGATINPIGYNVLPFANGTLQTTGVTNSSVTTTYTLNYGYTRNGSGNTTSTSATYTAYNPQWNGLSTSVTGVTGNTTYAAVTALGLTKVVQSSTVQTLNVLTTNNYVWLISTKQNATITQGGFNTSVSAVGVEDGSFWWQKQILLTLADGVTTQTLYTYRTRDIVNNTTSVIIQIS